METKHLWEGTTEQMIAINDTIFTLLELKSEVGIDVPSLDVTVKELREKRSLLTL